MAEFDHILPEPSLRETLSASAARSFVGTALARPYYWATENKDATPVTDAHIDQTLANENIGKYVSEFTRVKTQGDLDATVARVKHFVEAEKVSQASGWTGVGADVLFGIVDVPGLGVIKGTKALGTAALKPGARAVAEAGVVGTATAAHEAVRLSEDPTAELGHATVAVAGSMVLAGTIGHIAGKLSLRNQNKLGDGLAVEARAAASGELDTTIARMERTVADDTATLMKGGIVDTDNAITNRFKAANGEAPTSSQIALAKSLGVEDATRVAMKAFGRSIPLEMMHSESSTARDVAANLFALRGTLADGQTLPTSIRAEMMSVIHGERMVFNQTYESAYTNWAKEEGRSLFARALGTNVIERETSNAEFAKLVTMARVYGNEASTKLSPEMLAKIESPHIQRAARSYGDFDRALGERAVRSGLMRKDAMTDNHLHHSYVEDAVKVNEHRWVADETRAAFDKEWGKTVQQAQGAHDNAIQRATATYEQAVTKLERDLTLAKTNVEDAVAASSAGTEAKAMPKPTEAMVGELRKAVAETRTELRDLTDSMQAKLAVRQRDTVDKLNKLDAKRDAHIEEYRKVVGEAERQMGADVAALADLMPSRNAAGWQAGAKYERELAKVHKKNDKLVEDALDEIQKAERRHTRDQGKLFDRMKEIGADHNKDVSTAVDAFVAKRSAAIDKDASGVSQGLLAKLRADSGDALVKLLTSTSLDERVAMQKWADSHARGTFRAITMGDRGTAGGASSEGAIMGGNVRGGRLERNVYQGTQELLEKGWISHDILSIAAKQARADGADAVLAARFRRPMTEAEKELSDKGSRHAYWADGADPHTVPDLSMEVPLARIQKEFETLRTEASATGDVNRVKGLLEQERQLRQDLTDSVAIQRGQFKTKWDTFGPAATLAKGVSFSANMGMSFLTNLNDVALLAARGAGTFGDTLAYANMRLGDRFKSFLSGNGILDQAGKDTRQFALQAGIGAEQFGGLKMQGLMDAFDPYGAATSSSKMEAAGHWLTGTGSKLFGMNVLNNFTQGAAYGMGQWKFAKLALGGVAHEALDQADKRWLQAIGVTPGDLKRFSTALTDAGYSMKYGEHLAIDPGKLGPLGDQFKAAMWKHVTNSIVAPQADNLPTAFRNPVMQAVLQFQSYAMEAAQTVTMAYGQELRAGDPRGFAQFMIMAGILAHGTELMKVYAGNSGGSAKADKRLDDYAQAWERAPGHMFYTQFDKMGLMPLLSTMNSLQEGFTGFGLKAISQRVAGDEWDSPFARKAQAWGADNVVSPLGPTGRYAKDLGKVVSDVGGEVFGSKRGGLGATAFNSEGRITQSTVEKGFGLLPFSRTFYMKSALDAGIRDPLAAMYPSGKR